MRDAEQVAAMVRTVEAELAPIDVLVNNAGVILEKSFLDLTEQDWDHVLDTDLKSVFLCCRAVLPGMAARGTGVVINVASELGFLGRERYAPYCAAKAGVIGLTKSLARELAPQIRVNGIAPGPVNTPMLSPEQHESGMAAEGARNSRRGGSASPMRSPLPRCSSPPTTHGSIMDRCSVPMAAPGWHESDRFRSAGGGGVAGERLFLGPDLAAVEVLRRSTVWAAWRSRWWPMAASGCSGCR